MKNIKWTIMTLAILSSVGGALATRPQGDCRTQQQYIITSFGYMPAGTWGVNYLCDQSSNTCTYTFDGWNYWPCRTGDYRVILGGGASRVTNKK